MGFFKNLLKTGANFGSQVGTAIGRAASRTGSSAKTAAKISAIKMELNSLEEEFGHLYVIVGKKYIDYLIETDSDPDIDVEQEIKAIIPLIERRTQLERELDELEEADDQSTLMEDIRRARDDYDTQKRKLDQALRRKIITQEEYDEKLEQYQIRLDRFNEVKRLKTQYDMKIITKEELNAKLRALGIN